MEFRPCIDLHNGKVKQIIGSSLKDSDNSAIINFESDRDSSFYANMYREDNLRGGHIIKLGPENEDAAFSALQSYKDGLQIGGGVTADNCLEYLEAGASHVIVTSYVFSGGKIDYSNLKKLVSVAGKERIVLDLSCKKRDDDYFIVTDRWQKFTTSKIDKSLLEDLSNYCDEFLVHAASVEGKMGGADLELVELLAQNSPITVTYAGGIATVGDIEAVRKAGGNKIHITIGSALDIFGGDLKYRDVVNLCKK